MRHRQFPYHIYGCEGENDTETKYNDQDFFFFFFLRCKIKEKEPDTDGKKDERKLCKCQSSKEHQERRFLGEYLESLPLFIFFN